MFLIAQATADPAAGIGVLAALTAGLVSFLSPCVLPLVPGYLSAVTGLRSSELEDASTRQVLVPALLFVASFSVIFIALGLTATGLGSALSEHRRTLEKISAALIIAMGVFFIASIFIVRLNREWHVTALMERAGQGRADRRRGRVRDRLDAVHRADAGRDPLGGGADRVGREGRLSARRLLGGARDPVPARPRWPSRG